MENSVTLFTHSDFGRTLTSNGDGADHAWGGVQYVVGGAVRGQNVYGEYPLLQIGSAQDVGGGRFIPTTSADQYAATLASSTRNAWEMSFVSRWADRSAALWTPLNRLQHRLFRTATARGHEFFALARKR